MLQKHTLTNREKIQIGYDEMLATDQVDLVNGEVDADAVPYETSKRWGLSAILRLPVTFGETMQATPNELRQYTGHNHTFYQSTTFHVTLRSIEFFRSNISEGDEAVHMYAKLIRQLATQFPPLEAEFAGLSANRVGIIVQGYPVDEFLQAFRNRFRDLLADNNAPQGPEAQQPRLQAHVSVVVFGGPIEDATCLVDYIAEHREATFGRACFDRIDLVRYKRSRYEIAMQTLDQIDLMS